MEVMLIILLISVLCLAASYALFRNTHKINTQVDKANKELKETNDALRREYALFQNDCKTAREALESKEQELDKIEIKIKNKTDEIAELYKKAEETAATESKLQEQAFLNYCNVLEQEYERQDKKFASETSLLQTQIAVVRC